MLILRSLSKSYRLGSEEIPVLRGVDLQVYAGEMAVIMGPSGAGKTTLLNCIAGIDQPDGGSVSLQGREINYRSESERVRLRRHDIGMVFQFFNLIPTLSVRENVALPFLIANRLDAEAGRRVDELLAVVGMQHRQGHLPFQLSGGEMQLVSIARALAQRPALLLADEPTGNVNPQIGRSIMAILRKTAKREKSALLMVTHSPDHAAWADRVCFLKDGQIACELDLAGGQSDALALIHQKLLELGI